MSSFDLLFDSYDFETFLLRTAGDLDVTLCLALDFDLLLKN